MISQRSSQSLAFKEVDFAAPFMCGTQRMARSKLNMLSLRIRDRERQRQTREKTGFWGSPFNSYAAITGKAALESAIHHLHSNYFHFRVGPSPIMSDSWIKIVDEFENSLTWK